MYRLFVVALRAAETVASFDAALPRPNPLWRPLREVGAPHVADVPQVLVFAPEVDQLYGALV